MKSAKIKSMMCVAAALAVASGALAAESVKVETENTMMLFEREKFGAGDRLYLRHFGP